MENNWEDALAVVVTRRANRRSNTQGLPVRDNRVYTIRHIRDGYGVSSSAYYYRRHLNGGLVFTGPRSEGIARHLQNSTK